jgi:hypothetical protein
MVKNRVGGEQKTLLRAQQWPLEEGSLPEEKKKKIPGELQLDLESTVVVPAVWSP